MISTIPSLEEILSVMRGKGYAIFHDRAKKGYDLNIVGIRSEGVRPNRFDDLIVIFWMTTSGWEVKAYPATTDPGSYWLGSRWGGRMGTAILKEGQYRSTYQIGFHRGKYEALVQRKPVIVLRDVDRDGQIDFSASEEETGLFGINIHRAHSERQLLSIDAWSAGCSVIQSPHHFEEFMDLCKEAEKSYGNSFSYTLLNEKDFS